MEATALEGGFEDEPRQAARAFRGLMNAMARPGRIEEVRGAAPPAGLSPAAGTVLLTLADPETPVHLAGAADTGEIRAWSAFHCGAPLAPPAEAAFAVGRWDALGPLERYPVGTPEYPDRSTTLIVEMPELVQAGSVLTGPGIKDSVQFALPAPEALRRNAAQFPLGLDFYFTCGSRVAALPRTTRIG